MSAKLHDLSTVNDRLAEKVDDLIPRLFGNAEAYNNNRYWRMGDKHGAPGTSLAIWRSGPKQGEWCDFASGEGGRLLALVINAFGGDVGGGIRWAAEYVGEGGKELSSAERTARDHRDRVLREKRERARAADKVRMRGVAKGLFLSGVPIAGTAADRYLRGRAIDLGRLKRVPGAFRFHPAVKFPDDGVPRPCLLAAVVDGEGFLTVHRHWLECLPDGRVIKARVEDPKRSLSSWEGGLIPVWRGENTAGHAGAGWRDIKTPEQVIVTEGIEDALSIALAMSDMRIAASVTLGNLGKIWLPDAVDGIFWHRHRDTSREALSSYVQQKSQLETRGIDVRDVFAPDDHKDFNDWLQAEARRAADVAIGAPDRRREPERISA